MATIVYDGTSNQTVAKTDTVFLTAAPTNFTSAAELNGNVVLTFGSNTLTVTGTTLGAGGLPNISTPGGSFNYGSTSVAQGAGNNLAFLLGAGTTTALGGVTSTATTVTAAFGGLGRADSLDNAETVTIATGSAGSYLVYGNEGADRVEVLGALATNTNTTIFGGRGQDSIVVAAQTQANTNFAIYGGESGDAITFSHTVATGNVTIFGDTAAADAAGGNDTIALSTGQGGSSYNVFAAGGDDIITNDGTTATDLSGKAATFIEGSTATFFGGSGNDTISVGTTGGTVKATLTVYGGAGNDSIYVNNGGGTSTVYGGVGAADAADGNDTITIAGNGAFTVYANAGNDIVSATGLTAAATGTTTLSVFGGRGDDQITAGSTTVKANLALFGSENATENSAGDSITASNFVGGSTIIYGGTAAADAADGKDIISFTGNGTTTIYAAGGNDTVTINGIATVTDSAKSTVAVYGGAGDDSVTLLGTQGSNGTHTIFLGDGADKLTVGSTVAAAANTTTTAANTTNGNGTTQPEVTTVTFGELTAGNSVTVGGLTFKANVDLTASQVAAKFNGITSGQTADSLNTSVTDGFFTGGQTQWTYTAAQTGSTAAVVFTATTAGNADQATLAVSQAVGVSNGSGQGITVDTFVVGTDNLTVQNGIGGGGNLNIVNGTGQTIQTALDLAISQSPQSAGTVSAVLFQGAAYVVVNNDGNSTFNANSDLAIKLTGVSSLSALQGSVTII